MKPLPAHRYRVVSVVGKTGGSVTWCGRCGHVPLKNANSRKVSDKGCWSWDSKHRVERDEDDD